jgi:F420-non-reducing hydrogenase small subunit
MGPTAEIRDQGAAFLSTIASILGIDEETTLSDKEIEALIEQIKDPLGTFYRFGLPAGLIKRVIIK